jgi:hypothetical protein
MESIQGERWQGPDWSLPLPRRLVLAVLGPWLAACAMMLWFSAGHIHGLRMWDTDDYMRLQQVRDWLGGQSWFNVDQYRLDPPHGFHMHWSRIVDLPLAGLILLLRPLVGTVLAEIAASVIVPLITLGLIMAMVARVTRRVAGEKAAMLAPLLVACSPLILFHTLPLRIDHHGWQAAMAMATLAALLDRRRLRSGLLAGLFAAIWVSISLEALPLLAAMFGLLIVRFLIDPRHAERLHGFALALGFCCVALFASTHAMARWGEPDCDAMSVGYLGLLGGVAIAAIVATGPLVGRNRLVHAAIIAFGTAAGLVLFVHSAPACLAGPFGALDPVTRQYWYMNVLEGRPVWEQDVGMRGMLLLSPLLGLAGAGFGWHRARGHDPRAAANWMTMILLGGAAMAVSLMVLRAGTVAHGFALPGIASLLAMVLDRVSRSPRMAFRVLGSAAAILGMTPVAAAAVAGMLAPAEPAPSAKAPKPKSACPGGCDRYGALDRLPASYIFAPIDIGPDLIVHTPHSFPAAGYHRNPAALRRTIETFLGSVDDARRVIDQVDAAYVLIDPDTAEAATYRNAAPHGFMAQLLADKAPDWLEPVPLPGSTLRLWRKRA